MNPLTNMKNVVKLSELELKNSTGKGSWHNMYKDSAWIFVGGLPSTLTEGDVVCVFSQYGEIVHLNLIRDKDTGKSKGFGFICYEDQRSTILAVDNLNSIKIAGRALRVDHVADYKPPNTKNMNDETLELHLKGCGPEAVTKAHEYSSISSGKSSSKTKNKFEEEPTSNSRKDKVKTEKISKADIKKFDRDSRSPSSSKKTKFKKDGTSETCSIKKERRSPSESKSNSKVSSIHVKYEDRRRSSSSSRKIKYEDDNKSSYNKSRYEVRQRSSSANNRKKDNFEDRTRRCRSPSYNDRNKYKDRRARSRSYDRRARSRSYDRRDNSNDGRAHSPSYDSRNRYNQSRRSPDARSSNKKKYEDDYRYKSTSKRN